MTRFSVSPAQSVATVPRKLSSANRRESDRGNCQWCRVARSQCFWLPDGAEAEHPPGKRGASVLPSLRPRRHSLTLPAHRGGLLAP